MRDDAILEKRERAMELYEEYGPLLTSSQQRIFESYYRDDLSLSEIAENLAISRSAASESLRISWEKLEDFETKLGEVRYKKAIREQVKALSSSKEEEQKAAFIALKELIRHGI